MASNPKGFFRFAARYYPLLIDLFYRSEGVTEADLRDLTTHSRNEGDPIPSHVSDQLISIGMIEAQCRPLANCMQFAGNLPALQRLT